MYAHTLSNQFPSKILLAGEYAVIKGGDALVIPFERFSGAFHDEGFLPEEFVHHLVSSCASFLDLPKVLHLGKIRGSVKSNVPRGAGLGSSGVFCAAIYQQFAKEKLNLQHLVKLKNQLGTMEHFFHGKSSGLDPLVSFIKAPLFVSQDKIEIKERLHLPVHHHYKIWIWDTKINRETRPLVSWYLDASERDPATYQVAWPNLSNALAAALINEDDPFPLLSEIESFQSTYFAPMVPNFVNETLKPLKKLNSVEKSLFFKLCGAGGGGNFLLFTKGWEEVELSSYFQPQSLYAIEVG